MCAAAEQFLAVGFRETSMDSVAAAASVSKQTVYAHYGNKEALYRAVIAAKCKQHRLSDENLPTTANTLEALQLIGEHYMDLLCDPEVVAMYRVVAAESLNYPKIAVMFHESGPGQGHHALAGFLERHSQGGALNIDEPVRAATVLLSLLRADYQYALMLGLRQSPTVEERRAHVARVVAQFMYLYRSDTSQVLASARKIGRVQV